MKKKRGREEEKRRAEKALEMVKLDGLTLLQWQRKWGGSPGPEKLKRRDSARASAERACVPGTEAARRILCAARYRYLVLFGRSASFLRARFLGEEHHPSSRPLSAGGLVTVLQGISLQAPRISSSGQPELSPSPCSPCRHEADYSAA